MLLLHALAYFNYPEADVCAQDAVHVALTNALQVTALQGVQTGAPQRRIFETDWLGRTTSVVEPESGTTTYSYAYSTSAGLGLTVTRTRPRANPNPTAPTTITTTQYDTLGRVVSVNYTDGLTPYRRFDYDANIDWPQVTLTNIKGRLSGAGGGSGSTWNGSAFSYDVMGRPTQLWQCAPSTCGTSTQTARELFFGWDWVGNLIQESDPVSGTILYGRSIAGEVTSITNQTYTNLPYNPPNLVSNVVNGPNGPTSYTMGNGLNVYRSYDSLGRPAQLWVCNGPAAGNCSGGTALYGTASQWKGSQMQSQSDTVLNQGFSFGYTDGFNRLTSRTATSGPAQNYTYSYGVYGNRVSQNGGYTFLASFDPATNRINLSGYLYDAAGNLTQEPATPPMTGSNLYTYDAEGNVIKVVNSSGTSQYAYDVFNHRVHVQTPTATTEYTFDYAGRRVSTWYSPSANSGYEGRIYWDGQLFGYRAIDGNTYFDHQDLTGTERMRTTYSGAAASKYLSLPWGDGYAAANTTSADDQDNNHFAGLERDSESNTEHAQFRNYASVQGRWLSPDPYLGSYDFTNPQSFNRYTYALNNPLSFTDPSGLDTSQPVQCGIDNSGYPIYCITSVNGPGGSAPPSQPGNWCGGSSWGTQGCISWPCWMIPGGCSQPSGPPSSDPPPSSGGGAPNNGFNNNEQISNCLSSYYNSKGGKILEFGSLLSMVPGWDPQPGKNVLENIFLMGGKLIGLKGLQTVGQAGIQSAVSGTATSIASPLENLVSSGAGKALGAVGAAGPIAVGAATLGDIFAHGACTASAYPTPSIPSPF